jgi:hypothetical protein
MPAINELFRIEIEMRGVFITEVDTTASGGASRFHLFNRKTAPMNQSTFAAL